MKTDISHTPLPPLSHIFPEISPAELATLIDVSGVSQSMSPRHTLGEGRTLTLEDWSRLFDAGYLDEAAMPSQETLNPHFLQMANVLRDPATNLTVRIWAGEKDCADTNIQFPGSISDGRGVILLTGEDDQIKLSAYADHEHVIAISAPFLSWSQAAGSEDPLPPFEALLDYDSAMAVCAAVDYTHVKPPDVSHQSFSAEELYQFLIDRWGLTTFQELVTHGMSAIMAGEPPEKKAFSNSMPALVDGGIFKAEENDLFSLNMSFQRVARRISQPFAGLAWQRVAAVSDVELERSCQTFLAIDGGVLRLAPGHPGFLYFELGDYSMVRDFLAAELAAFPPQMPPPKIKNAELAETSPPSEVTEKNSPPPLPGASSPPPIPPKS
ncbi:MAG: hypothetical protein AB8F34_13500 [Akkermansiaceae bacterium]